MRLGVNEGRGSLLDFWFPLECARCGTHGGSPCRECLDDLNPAAPVPELEPLHAVLALVRYDDCSRPFVHDLKYRGRWGVARSLAPALATLVAEELAHVDEQPTLTWAPTTRARIRERGFDQAEVLARALGRELRRRPQRLLRRRAGVHQIGRSRRERATGVGFDPIGECRGVVVVVDDVVTTGATLRAAGEALCRAGASGVIGLALAATPTGDD